MLAQEGAPHDIERLLCKLEEEEARVLALRLGLRGQAVHNLVQVRSWTEDGARHSRCSLACRATACLCAPIDWSPALVAALVLY